MQNKSHKGITPYSGGFFPEIGLRIKLIYRVDGGPQGKYFSKSTFR